MKWMLAHLRCGTVIIAIAVNLAWSSPSLAKDPEKMSLCGAALTMVGASGILIGAVGGGMYLVDQIYRGMNEGAAIQRVNDEGIPKVGKVVEWEGKTYFTSYRYLFEKDALGKVKILMDSKGFWEKNAPTLTVVGHHNGIIVITNNEGLISLYDIKSKQTEVVWKSGALNTHIEGDKLVFEWSEVSAGRAITNTKTVTLSK